VIRKAVRLDVGDPHRKGAGAREIAVSDGTERVAYLESSGVLPAYGVARYGA
jgi:hypothetical protein